MHKMTLEPMLIFGPYVAKSNWELCGRLFGLKPVDFFFGSTMNFHKLMELMHTLYLASCSDFSLANSLIQIRLKVWDSSMELLSEIKRMHPYDHYLSSIWLYWNMKFKYAKSNNNKTQNTDGKKECPRFEPGPLAWQAGKYEMHQHLSFNGRHVKAVDTSIRPKHRLQ